MTEKIRIRATALTYINRRYAVKVLGEKVAVAFDRDSGARVAHGAMMIDGDIDSGGSRQNWFCTVAKGSVFELEVDAEAYRKNKNRLKNWAVEVL